MSLVPTEDIMANAFVWQRLGYWSCYCWIYIWSHKITSAATTDDHSQPYSYHHQCYYSYTCSKQCHLAITQTNVLSDQITTGDLFIESYCAMPKITWPFQTFTSFLLLNLPVLNSYVLISEFYDKYSLFMINTVMKTSGDKYKKKIKRTALRLN